VLQGVQDAWRTLLGLVLFRPHVLHICSSAQLRGPWDTLMLAAARLMRVRGVYHIHMGRLPEIMVRRGWEWRGMRWALKLADQVVVLDEKSEEALKSYLSAGKVARLPNAIALLTLESDRTAPEPQSGQNVLYAGHVVSTKGMRELMEVWRDLQPQGWCLRLAGMGSADYQKQLLGIVGENAGVEFLGDLTPEAVWRRMQAADIFVLPTHTEGFPNVILEAMAAGKAIISSRVGAIAEMLDADENEPCGIVVAPRDNAALAAALREFMGNPRLRETLGRRAKSKLERSYTTGVVFERLLALWRGVPGSESFVDVSAQRLKSEIPK
jgi:glycosyltransferase involved in cell wall biosynthesis